MPLRPSRPWTNPISKELQNIRRSDISVDEWASKNKCCWPKTPVSHKDSARLPSRLQTRNSSFLQIQEAVSAGITYQFEGQRLCSPCQVPQRLQRGQTCSRCGPHVADGQRRSKKKTCTERTPSVFAYFPALFFNFGLITTIHWIMANGSCRWHWQQKPKVRNRHWKWLIPLQKMIFSQFYLPLPLTTCFPKIYVATIHPCPSSSSK